MPRVRIATVLGAVLTLVLAGSALAAKVTGGTATITASTSTATALASNGISLTPISPATQSGLTLTFPIASGHVDKTTLRGVVHYRGGYVLAKGTKHVRVRDLVSSATKRHDWLYATVRRSGHHARVLRIVYFTHVTVSGGKATGTAHITRAFAKVVNALAGSHIVSAGAVLGTGTLSPTF